MKAIKVKFYPSKKQIELLEKHFGCNRFVYNWCLNKKTEEYNKNQKSISEAQLMRMITQLKKEKEFEWLKEPYSQTLQQSIKDLESAFSHFFRKNNQFPKFKSKHSPKQSFRYIQSVKVDRENKTLKLPKIGYVKFRDKFKVPQEIDFRNVTISRKNNKYYASIVYSDTIINLKKEEPELNKALGIDLGVRTYATFSDGTKIENPKHIKQHEDKLKKIQKKLSGQNKGSNKYKETKLRLGKAHEKLSNVRKDFLHKLTNKIVENQNYSSIAIEDLGVKEMQQENYSSMSKLISDASWRMFRSMLEYKCEEKGKNLLVINRFDASSKTCCNCGYVYNLSRSETEWVCTSCGVEHDRDVNASKNIRNFGIERFKKVGQTFSER
jgi:putative transposase